MLVVLLRGVNVGGNRKLPMADLRAAIASLGHTHVQTFIQSGNAVFRSVRAARPAEIAAEIGAAILETTGVDTPVIVRTVDELRRVVAVNPFLARGEDPDVQHVLFLDREPEHGLGELDPAQFSPQSFELVGREVFLHCPGGLSAGKMAVEVPRRLRGVESTARNWRTTLALLTMAEDTAAG